MKNEVTDNIKRWLVYFCSFLVILIYMELILKFATKGRLTAANLWMLCLIPAIALLFSGTVGFFKDKINCIILVVLVAALAIFYGSQLIYYKIFGSFWSFKMLKMGGAAVSNFFGAVMLAIGGNILFLILLLIPIALIIFFFNKKILSFGKYKVSYHLIAIGFFIPIWMLGVLILKIDGTGRTSAYHIYSSTLIDTDTTNGRFGSLSTLLIEAGMCNLNYGRRETTDALNEVAENMPGLIEVIDRFASLTPTVIPSPSAAPDQNAPEVTKIPLQTPVPTVPETEPEYWAMDIDFAKLAEENDNEIIKALCGYYANIKPSAKNDYTGMFEGYNLIYICAESFWTYAVHEAFTPTLYKLANNGIILNNFYNSFLNTTTNGEFAFATGLWPDVSREDVHNGTDVGSFPQSADNLMPYGLGNMFNASGAKSYAFHNYYGEFYSRQKSWPNLGYITKFKSDSGSTVDGMVFSSSWISSDLEMMEQSIDDYINEDVFHAYYMTFSGHGPYNLADNGGWGNDNVKRNFEEAVEINKEYDFSEEALCYLAANMELDKALEYLLERLDEAGKLDKTVIIMSGDHFPYYLSTNSVISELAGVEMTNDSIEHYKSSCIIYNSAIEEPIICDNYCSNVDIVPTVLNLFNLPFDSRFLSGKDIFATNINHKAILYNLSFINEIVEYDATDGTTEWKIDEKMYDDETLDLYIYSMSALIESEYAAALKMMDEDFFKVVYDYMNREEMPEETAVLPDAEVDQN